MRLLEDRAISDGNGIEWELDTGAGLIPAPGQPETEGRFPRLLFSVPSGRDFKYSVSFL